MIGLLTLAAIPTVTGVAQGISAQSRPPPSTPAQEEQQMRRFRLRSWCEGRSPGKRDVHNGVVVVGQGKVGPLLDYVDCGSLFYSVPAS